MKHVPPSVSAALKRRGRDDILQQDGEYEQYKSQIAQIIHGDDALQSDSEDYENDIDSQEPKMTPEEEKANKVIEGYGEKYADNNKETKESKTQRWNEIFNKMGLNDDDVFDMIDYYAFYEGYFDEDKLVEELGYEDVQELTNEDIINAIDDEDIVEIIENAGYLDEYEKATSDDAEDEEEDEDEQQYKVGTKFSAKNPFIKKEDQTYEITNIGKDYVEIAGPGGFSQRLSKEKFQKIIDDIKGR